MDFRLSFLQITRFPRALRFAESEGFEPPVPLIGYTAFRVRLFRPLRQLSLKAGAKVLLFYDICKFFCKKSTICGVFFDFNPQIAAFWGI